MNHLNPSHSPYLAQHSTDPVDWYEWGHEAFDKAARENKPILLSIGYSTCHWCHVMAEESYRNADIARILNRSFVCILVDREQRPDIDAVYMAACRSFTGTGGWPLTILMTPQGHPFYAGTYFPRHGGFGKVGFEELLLSAEEQWKMSPERLRKAGEHTTEQTYQLMVENKADKSVEPGLADIAEEQLSYLFDDKYGGFGSAPKFPCPHQLLYLLDQARRKGGERARNMALKTLRSMYKGGMFDHIGGGFCRYSTDAKFFVPHFEKMLIDNAYLTMAYLDAYVISGDILYKQVAERTISYVLREMRDETGGFFSAQDADANGEEGEYYLFRPEELIPVLTEERAKVFCEYYNITEEGNFGNKSIPVLLVNKGYVNEPQGLSDMRERVYQYRKHRMSLHTDRKILTGPTAIMAAALCRGYRVLGDEDYLAAAQGAVLSLHTNLTENDKLMASCFQGKTIGRATLEDHASLGLAYLELYRTTQDAVWLASLCSMMDLVRRDFYDEENGGYFMSAKDVGDLIVRPKELYDGSAPSGNSLTAYLLCALSEITGDIKWMKYADEQLLFMAPAIRYAPAGHAFASMALSLRVGKNRELVILAPDFKRREDALKKLYPFIGESLWVVSATPQEYKTVTSLAPMMQTYEFESGKTKFFLCKDHNCLMPVYSVLDLISLLNDA